MGLFFSRMRRDPLFCVLAALLLLWIAAMFAVPPFLPYDAYTNDMGARLLPPSAEHILGTDQLGRDLLSRVLVGGQARRFPSSAQAARANRRSCAPSSGFCRTRARRSRATSSTTAHRF